MPLPRKNIINEADEAYLNIVFPPSSNTFRFVKEFLQQNQADEEAGYPPNCNTGYVEKDGKCVPQKDKPE